MGFQPILLPLTETVALPVDADAAATDAAAVAVTSANAVRHAPKELIAALAALPCHAVGNRTAEAARAAGFSVGQRRSGRCRGAGRCDRRRPVPARRSSISRGRVRFPAFEERLTAAGVEVRAIETYDTIALDYSDDEILARLSDRPVDAVLLYSAKAAAAMRDLGQSAGSARSF